MSDEKESNKGDFSAPRGNADAERADAKPDQSNPEKQEPAVPIEKSVNEDRIICLEDGKSCASLVRHLKENYGMTPEEYRKKWGLPDDYPMISASYAAKREALAKKIRRSRE